MAKYHLNKKPYLTDEISPTPLQSVDVSPLKLKYHSNDAK